MKKNIKDKKLQNIFIIILVVGLMILFGLYKCPFKMLFGISCPGCGMTRALMALATLDFSAAIHYHPAVFVLVIFVIGWLLDVLKLIKLNAQVKKLAVIIFCAVMIGVYIFRVINGSPVVTFEFNKSLIGKLIIDKK